MALIGYIEKPIVTHAGVLKRLFEGIFSFPPAPNKVELKGVSLLTQTSRRKHWLQRSGRKQGWPAERQTHCTRALLGETDQVCV